MTSTSQPNYFRITGNPENFHTAVATGIWAFNEQPASQGVWSRIREGDILFFHATGSSSFPLRAKSSLIGYGLAGATFVKSAPNWIQEFPEGDQLVVGVKNPERLLWNYAVELSEAFLTSEFTVDDFNHRHQNSNLKTIRERVEALLSSAVPLARVNELLQVNGLTNFPHNGSTSSVDPAKAALLMDLLQSAVKVGSVPEFVPPDELITRRTDKDHLRSVAKKYKHSGKHYKESNTPGKRRLADKQQLWLVAELEDRCCQLCGYKQDWVNSKGGINYIFEIDHLRDKSLLNGEEADNLMCLCPTCHAEKTRGVITVDVEKQELRRNGVLLIPHHDNHLNWWSREWGYYSDFNILKLRS